MKDSYNDTMVIDDVIHDNKIYKKWYPEFVKRTAAYKKRVKELREKRAAALLLENTSILADDGYGNDFYAAMGVKK